MSKTTNIINNLAASMAGVSVNEYVQQHEEMLLQIDKIEQLVKNIKIKTIQDYQQAYKYKNMISSIFCYFFNNHKPEWEKIANLEGMLGGKMAKFVRSYKKITPQQRKLGKYILWNKYYYSEKQDKIAEDLIKADMLRKKDGKYFIIGFNLAVGDNVFGISYNARGRKIEYRKYNKVCCFMAIGITRNTWTKILNTKNIPELEEYYETFYKGDFKGGVKITMSWKDKEYIRYNYCRVK